MVSQKTLVEESSKIEMNKRNLKSLQKQKLTSQLVISNTESKFMELELKNESSPEK